jgi:RimJ/RimL family protein N-acetyltransferase
MSSPPSVIPTTRLLLRAWEPQDAHALRTVLHESRDEIGRWIPWVLDGMDTDDGVAARIAQHAESFAKGTEWLYGIFDPDHDALLGGCGLHPRVGPGGVEIGYWVATGASRRGIATEAARALTETALAMPGITRVEIRCEPANEASARIPARLGFTHVETLVVPSRRASPPTVSLQLWQLTRTA